MANNEHLVVPHDTKYGIIRTTTITGRTWYIVADIIRGMKISNPTVCMYKVSAENKRNVPLFANQRYYPMNVVNKAGVMEMLTNLKSKDAAFNSFLSEEFLPEVEPDEPKEEHSSFVPPENASIGAENVEDFSDNEGVANLPSAAERIFSNPEFGNVRTIVEDDKVLFCANDVAQALGYSNLHDALIKYCKHSTLITGVANRDPDNKVSFRARKYIPEGDVYRLIVSSKLPGAEKFERWVFDEVLPSIRKHGVYAVEEVLNDPDMLIGALTALKEERAKSKALAAQNAVLLPKAQHYDKIYDNKTLINVTSISKEYGMSAKDFNDMLHELGIQWWNGGKTEPACYELYAKYQNKGYAFKKTAIVGDGSVISNTLKWTQKGRKFLYDFLKERGIYTLLDRGIQPDSK